MGQFRRYQELLHLHKNKGVSTSGCSLVNFDGVGRQPAKDTGGDKGSRGNREPRTRIFLVSRKELQNC